MIIDKTVLQRIGLHAEKGFPYEAYSFTDGQLSLQVERNGGFNELRYLSILEEGGTFHPERYPLPIFSRYRAKNYHMYGPVVRFASTFAGGRTISHTPDNVWFLPFGFSSTSERFGVPLGFDLCMRGNAVVSTFRNAAPNREFLDLMFCLPGLARGEFRSWIKPKGWEIAYPPERMAVLRWDEIQFDPRNRCLTASGQVFRYLGHSEPVCLTIAADAPVVISHSAFDHRVMRVKWGRATERRFVIALEPTFDQCLESIRSILREPEKPWNEQVRHYVRLADRLPQVEVEGHPIAGDMARTIPLFINSLKLHETPSMVTNRGAVFKYGYFPHWDVQWTTRATLLSGQYEHVKKTLRHALTQLEFLSLESRFEGEVFLLLAEYYALTRDFEFVRSCYPVILPRVQALLDMCAGNGLMPGGQYGADDFRELRIPASLHYTPDCSGYMFSAVRAMENLAMLMGDGATERRCRETADRAQAIYLKMFFDRTLGYFPVAVTPKGDKACNVYENVGTLAMEGPYGDLLVDEVVERLAAFQRDHLYHPAGRSAVPYWCDAEEMWKSCIMLQHAHHEMRTLRWARETGELMRMWRVYQDLFDACKLQIETINLNGMPGDPTGQRSDWEGFGASMQYNLLMRAMIGIESDYRSLTYIPCHMPVAVNLKSFPHGATRWTISIRGDGHWVSEFRVDGHPVEGALMAPSHCFDEGEHDLVIIRGEKAPAGPCILHAVGAGVTVTKSEPRRVAATLDGCGRIPVRFYAPTKPRACRVNGKPAAFTWNPAKRTGVVEVIVRGTARLEVECRI
jgi:hypothetical protein